jgi:hypothetical protein
MPLQQSRILEIQRTRLLKVSMYAMYFNGINNYVEMFTAIPGREYFSWEGFLYRTKKSERHDDNNWITGNRQPTYSWYSAFDYGDRVGVWYYGSGWIYGPVVPRREWHHIAVVIDGPSGEPNNLKIYLDGRLAFQTTITYSLSLTTSKPWVGGRVDRPCYFGGFIAYIRVYTKALISDEVVWNFLYPWNPVRSGLALWLMAHPEYIKDVDGDGVLEWIDLSGNNNHGKIYGATLVEVGLTKAPARVLARAR